MLDFYCIYDNEIDIDWSNEDDIYAGGLGQMEFESLANIWKECASQGIQFYFYDDTRIYSKDIIVLCKVTLKTISESITSNNGMSHFPDFLMILYKALDRKCGLITQCD